MHHQLKYTLGPCDLEFDLSVQNLGS